MKILLLGKGGQVGMALQSALLPLGELVALGRAELHLENLTDVARQLAHHRPDIIVNAAAYTAVDKAESDTATAFLINATVVGVLSDWAKQNSSLLVHYSTDYVFDGTKQSPYIETDQVNPQNVYGASKRAGEEAILQSGCNALIFRTSWVFSSTGNNFIKTILKLAKSHDSIRVVSDQHGTPTSAEYIADITALAITAYRNHSLPNGLYHLTATGTTSWFDFACYIVERALSHGITLKLTPEHILPISTDKYPLPARRPKNSTLDISALSNILALQMADWRIYVDQTIEKIAQQMVIA
ncbi:MAG TPA: dTDP-4-dehydrorhamnose reductase [Legionella sp.]|nr:dTDP-4-dehydrorhamnose reductase [Legionella sp.]